MIYRLNGIEPKLDENCYVADTASVIGRVFAGKNVSVWFSAVVRGDVCNIHIGDRSNIQDNVTVHGDAENDVVIGKNVTIGHNCVIHGCTIGDNCVIGMGSTILNGAVIPPNSIVGAGSLVTSTFKSGEEGVLIIGSPARTVKKLSERYQKILEEDAQYYVDKIETYSKELERVK